MTKQLNINELSQSDSNLPDDLPDKLTTRGVSASSKLKSENLANIKELSLLPDDVAAQSPVNSVRVENQPKDIPTFQGFKKGFKVFLDDNTVLSTTKYINENGFNLIPEQLNPNYDPFNDIPEDKLNYVDNYKYANTPEEVSRISARIDKELENKRILNEEVGTGAQLTSGLLAGIFDPINFIPVGGEMYKSFQIGNVGRGALRTATAGFLSQTAAEGILQAEQETRTKTESAINIASATILSGVLGAAGSLLSKDKFHEVSGKVNKDINSEKADLIIDPATQELKPNNKSELVRNVDPEVQKVVDEFLNSSKNLPESLSAQNPKNKTSNLAANEPQLSLVDNTQNAGKLNQNLLEPVKTENYTSSLDKFTPIVYHETNPNKALELLPFGGVKTDLSRDSFFLANSEDLAKGQGENTNGITIAFDSKGINGQLNKDKPNWDFLYQNDQAEFNSKYTKQADYQKSVVSFKVPDDLKLNKLSEKQLQKVIDNVKENGWTEIKEDGFTEYKKNPERKIVEKPLETPLETQPEIQQHPEEQLQTEQPDEARSVGARQNLPYQDLYDKYLEENLPTGKQPITFEQFRNGMESLTSGIGGTAKGVAKSLSKTNPLLRTFNSKSIEAKTLLQELGTHNMLVGKNEAGIASQQSVETAIKQWRAGLGEAIQSNTKSFKDFKNRAKKENIQTRIKTIADFNIEVSKALRRGDISEIKEVANAAKTWRSKVFDPLKDAAIAEKLLPEDVKPETAVSYLSRLWNRKAIIAQEPELRRIISDKLIRFELPKIEGIEKKELADLAAKIEALEAKQKPGEEVSKSLSSLKEKYSKLSTEHDFHFGDFKQSYVKEIVDSIISNLKGEQRFGAVTNYDFKITNRGPLKERTLSFIRDEEVEKFLENDVERIANRYTRIMGTDVELKRQFGDVNFQERLNKVSEEYKTLAEKAKTEKERVSLQKEKKQVLGDLQALGDIMRGIYGTPENPDSLIVRGGRIGRQLAYVTRLGGVVASSLSDSVMPIFNHGIMRFSQGLGHLIINMKGIKLNVREAKRAGNILESVLHSRLASMAEITDPYNSGHSVFERFIDNVQKLGSKLNGLGLWTDTMKSFSSVLTQQRLIKEANNLLNGKIKKTDRTYLASLGIDVDNVKSITNQIDKFGTKEGNLWVANADKWTDKEAVRLYRNALNQDVDRTIVTPNAGDVPLFMHTELGKTIGQFKSFTFASTQQVLIRGLQQKDAAALNGTIALIAMGMLIYHVKSLAAGKETSDDPRKWIAEGVDRSGILGIIMEINNISEKMTRGRVGINGLIGGEIMSRYASRNIADTFLGPTAGQLKDMASITGAIASGDIKESDVKAFRRMLPYQNVFYLNSLFNELEQKIDEKVVTE